MSDKPIGYRNPPVHSRYKKGQSGNPGGKKTGSKNFKTLFREVMESQIEVTENGRNRQVPVSQALILKQVDCGLKGDWKATESLLDRYERYSPDRSEPERELPEEDEQMRNRFLDRRGPSDDPENDG